MKVQMLTQTFWSGEVRRIDDEVTVDSVTGQRWIDKGIASFIESTPTEKTMDEPIEGTYSGKKAKELYDLCVERGISAEAKKAATYYVDLLEAADAELKTDSESNEQKEEA